MGKPERYALLIVKCPSCDHAGRARPDGRVELHAILFGPAYLLRHLFRREPQDIRQHYIQWHPGIPVFHPALVAAGAMDGAVRRDGGGGYRGESGRHMDSVGQQEDEECNQLLLRIKSFRLRRTEMANTDSELTLKVIEKPRAVDPKIYNF
ncbi:hypothetical protein ACJJTC_003444 [Scirpophaga incertulas]